MLQINTAKSAKKSARALEKFLAKSGVELEHGKALDAIAVLSGFKDWNSMARATSTEAVNAQLDDFELSHIEENQDVDYGLEHATVTHTGFELRYGAEGDVVDYVRVCDPLGREVAYWVSDEWEEDPQVVMGAILGALTRGRPELRGKQRTAASKAGTTHKSDLDLGNVYGTRVIADKAVPATPVRIDDVPLEEVSNVLINGVSYSLRYYDSQVLGLLYEPAGDDDSAAEGLQPVLELVRAEDGREWEESVSLAQLRSMTWYAPGNCFKSADGDEYVFFTEERFSPAKSAQQSTKVSAPVAEATQVPASQPASDESLKLYKAEVYAQEHDDSTHLGTWLGLARNSRAAYDAAMDKFWDARLDGAGCRSYVEVEEEDEDNHAPFKVLVNKDIHFDVESLAEGIQTAERLIENANHRRVSLVTGDDEEILVLTR